MTIWECLSCDVESTTLDKAETHEWETSHKMMVFVYDEPS